MFSWLGGCAVLQRARAALR